MSKSNQQQPWTLIPHILPLLDGALLPDGSGLQRAGDFVDFQTIFGKPDVGFIHCADQSWIVRIAAAWLAR
jgi:hypothetical protein